MNSSDEDEQQQWHRGDVVVERQQLIQELRRWQREAAGTALRRPAMETAFPLLQHTPRSVGFEGIQGLDVMYVNSDLISIQGPPFLCVLAIGDQNHLSVRGAPDQGDSVGVTATYVGSWHIPLTFTFYPVRAEINQHSPP